MSISEKEMKNLTTIVNKKYEMLGNFITGVAKGKLPAVCAAGERGLGKSFTIMEILEAYKKEGSLEVSVNRGHISPLALYNKLYEYRDRDSVLWFDDCDSVFTERESLNILKAAMDTLPKRIVTWCSTSSLVEVQEFEFKGRIVISTNVNLAKSAKQSVHIAAFLDRIFWHRIDLTLEEKFVKITQIAKQIPGDAKATEEVLEWIKENLHRIGKLLSLRTFVKVIKLANFSKEWKELAESMVSQDEQLAKELEEIEVKVGKVGKTKGGGKVSDGTAKPKDRQTKGYKEGTTLWTLQQTLFNAKGKPVDKKMLLSKIKGQCSDPEGRLKVLQKEGLESKLYKITIADGFVKMDMLKG